MLTHFMTLQAQRSILFIVCFVLFVVYSSFFSGGGGVGAYFMYFYLMESGILMANSFLPDLQ